MTPTDPQPPELFTLMFRIDNHSPWKPITGLVSHDEAFKAMQRFNRAGDFWFRADRQTSAAGAA